MKQEVKTMDDAQIVDLYWQRSDEAIRQTQLKYGRYCHTIAYNILASDRDAEECVNDTYLAAWNSMPDKRPSALAGYLGKITRNFALTRLTERTRQKRGGGETALVLEELSECLAAPDAVERQIEARELTQCLDRFLYTLPKTQRQVFLSRYWYMASIEEIAKSFGFSRSKVTSMLHRTRKKLQAALKKEDLI